MSSLPGIDDFSGNNFMVLYISSRHCVARFILSVLDVLLLHLTIVFINHTLFGLASASKK